MLKHTSKFVIITSPELRLPTTLEKNLAVVDYPLPGSPQLRACVMAAKKILWSVKRISKEVYDSDPEPVIRSLMGLTLQEADDALAKSVVVKDCFDVGVLNDLKRQVVRKGELLDQIFTEETIDNIGGMQGIKEYLRLRKSSFGEDARAYGLTSPKGIFLLGVQGCGKSLCAKAVANEFQIPLLKLDMGRLFSSYVGESEGNVRRAIKIAEGIAPCVLFIDELDKAFSGTTGSQGDGGVTRRVIGSILDWMQEKKAPVFVVAASNSIDGIPPAVVRRGRFDERFFVDLPTRDERRVIFAIHLAKRGRDPAKFDLDSLASSSDNFSGAEIESVIEDAMRWAFADRKREFTTEDVVNECRVCVPLYVTMKDEIDGLRNGIVGRMRMANLPLRPDLPDEENKPLSRFEKL
jgi:SpoVK/Ycf46/Vps4 family AAA+-type ATPase